MIEQKRRNYFDLINTIAELREDGQEGFHCLLIGRSTYKSGREIKKKIRSSKAKDSLTLTNKNKNTYSEFYDSIAQLSFICPLIDTTSTQYSEYFNEKSTSSLPVAFGFNIIPIIHASLAKLHAMESCSITYTDGKLYKALKTAISLSPHERNILLENLMQKQLSLLTQSTTNFQKIMESVLSSPEIHPLC